MFGTSISNRSEFVKGNPINLGFVKLPMLGMPCQASCNRTDRCMQKQIQISDGDD